MIPVPLKRLGFPTFAVLWAAGYYAETLGKHEYGRVLIEPVFWFLLPVYSLICLKEYRGWRAARGAQAPQPDDVEERRGGLRQIACLPLSCLYLGAIAVLGFFCATVVFLAWSVCRLGTKNRLAALALAVVFAAAVQYCFRAFLGVPLPAGFWASWAGWM